MDHDFISNVPYCCRCGVALVVFLLLLLHLPCLLLLFHSIIDSNTLIDWTINIKLGQTNCRWRERVLVAREGGRQGWAKTYQITIKKRKKENTTKLCRQNVLLLFSFLSIQMGFSPSTIGVFRLSFEGSDWNNNNNSIHSSNLFRQLSVCVFYIRLFVLAPHAHLRTSI